MEDSVSRIGVLFGGPSPEHDVSILTGLQAARALRQSGRQVHALYWTKAGAWQLVGADLEATAFAAGVPAAAESLQLVLGEEGGFQRRRGRFAGRSAMLELDVAVICCHGGPGEDGVLQGALDLLGLPYTGPSAAAAALGMDKLAQAAVLASAGLPALPRLLLARDAKEPAFAGPYIVKPRFGGSSIGIEVVADFATAQARLGASVHLRRGAILEPLRPDLFDLQVAIRTWPTPELSAIERPIRRSSSAEILDYADKYVGGEGMLSAPRELPAELEPAVADELRALALAAGELLGARGVNRIDFLSDGRQLFVNEINTVPGSLSRHLFVDPPVPFVELLDAMIAEARQRPATVFSSAGADGTVLSVAGTIAGKLA